MLKDNIRKCRLQEKMTQQKIADILNVSRQAVTRWENGDVEPSTENLIALSRLFNCTVDDLVNNTKDNKSSKINIKEDSVFWTIERNNSFIIILSIILLIFYVIQITIWSYSMLLFMVIEAPIFLVTILLTAIIDPIAKTKDGFLRLLKPYIVIFVVQIAFILIVEI